MGMKATVLLGTALCRTGSCPPSVRFWCTSSSLSNQAFFSGRGNLLGAHSLPGLCWAHWFHEKTAVLPEQEQQQMTLNTWPSGLVLHCLFSAWRNKGNHQCGFFMSARETFFYNFVFLQIYNWAPHMEHLILVEVLFSGEKASVGRPGAVSRLPRCMVWGHSIKQALSEQRTSGFLCSHCFRTKCPSSRKF